MAVKITQKNASGFPVGVYQDVTLQCFYLIVQKGEKYRWWAIGAQSTGNGTTQG